MHNDKQTRAHVEALAAQQAEIEDARDCLDVCLTRCTRDYCVNVNRVVFTDASPLCDMAIGYVRVLLAATAPTPAQEGVDCVGCETEASCPGDACESRVPKTRAVRVDAYAVQAARELLIYHKAHIRSYTDMDLEQRLNDALNVLIDYAAPTPAQEGGDA